MLINGGTGISFAELLFIADVEHCAVLFLLPLSKLLRSFNFEANALAVIGFTGEPVCVMDDWLSLK